MKIICIFGSKVPLYGQHFPSSLRDETYVLESADIIKEIGYTEIDKTHFELSFNVKCLMCNVPTNSKSEALTEKFLWTVAALHLWVCSLVLDRDVGIVGKAWVEDDFLLLDVWFLAAGVLVEVFQSDSD